MGIQGSRKATRSKARAKPEPGEARDGYWHVQDFPGPPRDIYFRVLKTGCPPTLQVFKHDVERCLSAAHLIFRVKAEEASKRGSRALLRSGQMRHVERYDAYMAKYAQTHVKLLNLACLGLEGSKPALTEACAALASLKAELVEQEGGRIKNEYMRRLGLRAFVFGTVMLVLYALFERFPWLPSPEVLTFKNVLLVFVGAAMGTWASFATRKSILEFADLAVLEEDRLDPSMRIAFAAILTFFLTLTFLTGFAVVSVGQFSSANLLTSAPTAILFGAFAGLSEKALPTALGQRAQAILARTSGSAATSA